MCVFLLSLVLSVLSLAVRSGILSMCLPVYILSVPSMYGLYRRLLILHLGWDYCLRITRITICLKYDPASLICCTHNLRLIKVAFFNYRAQAVDLTALSNQKCALKPERRNQHLIPYFKG
jgi:hypothetical protein